VRIIGIVALVVVGLVIVGGVVVALASIPDFRRYQRMRSM
jgi:hypothetical protein